MTSSEISKKMMIDKVLDFFITFNQAAFQELLGMIKVEGQFMKVNRKLVHERLDFHAEKTRENLMIHLMKNNSKISLSLDYWIAHGMKNDEIPQLIECRHYFENND